MTIEKLAETIFNTSFNLSGLKSLLEKEFKERFTKEEIAEYTDSNRNETAFNVLNDLTVINGKFDIWIKNYRKKENKK